MQRLSMTGRQLLLLVDMCLDAEERCRRKLERAKAAKDDSAADHEAARMREYAALKSRLFEEMKSAPGKTQDLGEMLQNLSLIRERRRSRRG